MLLAFVCAATGAKADCTEQSIRLVVPAVVGSNADTVARRVADRLCEKRGIKMTIENVAGADGLRALKAVASAEQDSNTLLMGNTGTIVAAPLVSPMVERPTGFKPVSTLEVHSFFVVTSIDGIKTSDDLKKVPPKEIFGAGATSSPTINICLSAYMQGVGLGPRLTLIHYEGAANQGVLALLRREADIGCASASVIAAGVKEGTLHVLGTVAQKRSVAFPEVPTLQQQGIKTFGKTFFWSGIFAPPGTPDRTVARLNGIFCSILDDPVLVAQLEKLEVEAGCSTPRFLEETLRDQTDEWRKVVTTDLEKK